MLPISKVFPHWYEPLGEDLLELLQRGWLSHLFWRWRRVVSPKNSDDGSKDNKNKWKNDSILRLEEP